MRPKNKPDFETKMLKAGLPIAPLSSVCSCFNQYDAVGLARHHYFPSIALAKKNSVSAFKLCLHEESNLDLPVHRFIAVLNRNNHH